MKKRITYKGKTEMCNTDLAKKVATRIIGKKGLNYINETLYRAKSGRYFLYGFGGKLTVWGGNPDIKGFNSIRDVTVWLRKEYVKKENIKSKNGK